jgi:hypothetical protein
MTPMAAASAEQPITAHVWAHKLELRALVAAAFTSMRSVANGVTMQDGGWSTSNIEVVGQKRERGWALAGSEPRRLGARSWRLYSC